MLGRQTMDNNSTAFPYREPQGLDEAGYPWDGYEDNEDEDDYDWGDDDDDEEDDDYDDY